MAIAFSANKVGPKIVPDGSVVKMFGRGAASLNPVVAVGMAALEQQTMTAAAASFATAVDGQKYAFLIPSLTAAGITGVTAAAATDIFTKTAHGLSEGDVVTMSALTGGAGIIVGARYYVRRIDANTFKLSLAPGGSAYVDVTSDLTAGTLTKELAAPSWAILGNTTANETAATASGSGTNSPTREAARKAVAGTVQT